MDVTDATKDLIQRVQGLKSKHSDPVSVAFIDFYSQCRQGVDYLFPEPMRASVRLLDILNWFFACVDGQASLSLMKLMWQDIVGPTLQEYERDATIEQNLRQIFESGSLKQLIASWDRERNSDGSDRFQGDGSVHLVMRGLLGDIYNFERQAGF